MKTNPDHIAKLLELFSGNTKAHGTHGEPDQDGLKWKIKRTARTLDGGATQELWQQHVRGECPLGVIPIRGDNTCLWASIDVDDYEADVIDIIRRIDQQKLPLVPCRSKSGGLHLFCFLHQPSPAGEVHDQMKLASNALDLNGSEIFPKQTSLDLNATGNWMVMPYFGGDFGGKLKMQHGLKKHGDDMTLTEFLHAAVERRTTVAELAAANAKLRSTVTRRAKTAHGKKTALASVGDFSDGPPCLQTLARQPLEDGRKRTVFMMAIYHKRSDPTDWADKVEESNHRHLRPPLPPEEVRGVIRSLRKKDYNYTCREQPMCAVCDSKVCRARTFGVGDGGVVPVIVSVRKIPYDEPEWRVTIEGSNEELIISETRDLTDFKRFNNQCAKQLNRFFALMKQADWNDEVGKALAKVEVAEPPEDTTEAGQFLEHLEEFLTNRWRGTRREDVLMDRPWEDEDEGKHFFMMRALTRFLERERVRDVKASKCRRWIENLGGGTVPTTINHKRVRLWWVPSGVIRETPPLPPPKPVGSDGPI